MPTCPSYRLRAFLSVDLVGSTEFKTDNSDARNSGVFPGWAIQIKRFYQTFPKVFRENFDAFSRNHGLEEIEVVPALWKTIGDEIVFCGRVYSLEHFAACISAFMTSLESYGSLLESDGLDLDVKGAAWVAGFPAPNITVNVASLGDKLDHDIDLPDEEEETRADSDPRSFDFLGKDIDTGFRIAKRAEANRLILSGDAAHVLCEAANERVFNGTFLYVGREVLKGVMKGRPYPIIAIDTERKRTRREIADLERKLTNQSVAEASMLSRFLKTVFDEENIELAALRRRSGSVRSDAQPKHYKEFVETWRLEETELSRRERSEEAAAKEQAGDLDAIDPAVEQQLDQIIAASDTSFAAKRGL